MIVYSRLLNPTRIIALSASGFALAACVITWQRGRRLQRRRGLSVALGALQLTLLFDLVFNGRWLLHDQLARVARSDGFYSQRSGPQHVALAVIASLFAVCIGWVLWVYRDRPGAFLATCGGIFSLCCWCVEVISLHGVDSLLYHKVNGVMPVRLAVASFAVMTGIGILWDTYGAVPPWAIELPSAH